MQADSRRAILAAFFANMAIAIGKFGVFLVTGAVSLLAEAAHSVADSGNQLLLILGGVRAKRPATPQHPFGYGQERYFWSFIVAVVLFTMGSLFAIVHGVEQLRHPEPLSHPAWAIGMLGVAIIFEAISLRVAITAASRQRAGKGWWDYIRHAKEPELPVVLLEDIGALSGLVIALIAVSLALWTGDPRFDGLGSLIIGLLLAVIAAVLGSEMKSLLMGESAAPQVQEEIQTRIEAHPQLRRVLRLQTQHLGPEQLLVAVRVEFNPGLTLREAAAVIAEIEARLREQVPAARAIYIQPEIPEGPEAPYERV